MLEVLNKHLSEKNIGCIVNVWINTLQEDEKQAFDAVKENSARIQIASLYKELNDEDALPFKLTAFRSHMRGYCTCRN